MMKIIKIAGLLAITFGTTACVTSERASQNDILAARPFVAAEPASQKFDIPYEEVSKLDLSPTGAAEILKLSSDAVQPNVPLVTKNQTAGDGTLLFAAAPSYRVTEVYVDVPASLTVSEANRYLPSADIVWREDPIGDRRAQVKTILENAILTGAAKVAGDTEVIMSVRVRMFHALSQKARYSVGGRHNIKFDYVLLDAQTGKPLTDVLSVETKLKAFGGRRAIEAELRGETQKVRITRHVAEVVYLKLMGSTAI